MQFNSFTITYKDLSTYCSISRTWKCHCYDVLLNSAFKIRQKAITLQNAGKKPDARRHMLRLHTHRRKNALAINARCTIRLTVLMLLLRVVMLVWHLEHLSGCESSKLPAQLRRFLSISRISSMSYHRLGLAIVFSSPGKELRNAEAQTRDRYMLLSNVFAIEPVPHIARGRLTHPPVFWRL